MADRGNNRIQIFDQDGKFLDEWKQFSRPSGIYIDRNDVLYVADSESNGKVNPGWKRGIRVGGAKDGKVTAFIPDTEPDPEKVVTSNAEGVAADAQGNVYGAEVGPQGAEEVRQEVGGSPPLNTPPSAVARRLTNPSEICSDRSRRVHLSV